MARGGWRPGGGRKKGPPELRRSHRLTLFFTDSEYARLLRAAEKREVLPGTLAREMVIRGLRRRG